MLNAAQVLPAGPGEPEADVFPLQERLRFRDNIGLGLRDVRQRPAFASLPRGPWFVFIGKASTSDVWRLRPRSFPFSASNRRSASMKRRRFCPSRARSTRFSARKYSMASPSKEGGDQQDEAMPASSTS
jgi:hypothetical protein